MTSPRPAGPADSAPNRFAARAVDLGAVKEAADARDRAKEEAASGAPVALAAPVTAESFEQDLVVRSTQVPVIVQLGSSRAPGSDEMSQAFASTALGQTEPASWVFRYVDVDTVPEIAQAFGVQSVPTVLALAAGGAYASRPAELRYIQLAVGQADSALLLDGNQSADQFRGCPAAGADRPFHLRGAAGHRR